jgi:inosine/xanthosine triphosphate pyrophosphatase family protein
MTGTPFPILLATTNLAKQAKLRWVLEDLPLSLHTPQEFGISVEVPEDAPTHQQIALRKAQAWSHQAEGVAIASDGGLMIPALGSEWSSLHTHRFAGPDADDLGRLDRLIKLLTSQTSGEQSAHLVEAVAVAWNGTTLAVWEATGASGILAPSYDPKRVDPGFWAASILYFQSHQKLYLDMSSEEQAEAGDAWGQLKPKIQDFFQRFLVRFS